MNLLEPDQRNKYYEGRQQPCPPHRQFISYHYEPCAIKILSRKGCKLNDRLLSSQADDLHRFLARPKGKMYLPTCQKIARVAYEKCWWLWYWQLGQDAAVWAGLVGWLLLAEKQQAAASIQAWCWCGCPGEPDILPTGIRHVHTRLDGLRNDALGTVIFLRIAS